MQPSISFDSALTDLARIYAGMLPLDTNRFRNLTGTKGWQVHRQLSDTNWAKFGEKAKIMEAWRDSILPGIKQEGATLFYPFSGPDILNADIFFPSCDKYVFFSLEKIGTVPKWDIKEAHFNDFLEDSRIALADIFVRNYFITRRMEKEFRTEYLQGNMTAFLVFLARRNCEIVSVKNVFIDSAGVVQYLPSDTAKTPKRSTGGVEIRYAKIGATKIQDLYYFPCDIQDSMLQRKPRLVTYIHSLPDKIMFTKAASYLMHDNVLFSKIRALCLESKVILQEDSGIPYQYFKPDQWTVSLFGKYTKPIKDFNYGFQKDLDAAYKAGTNVHPLSFSIGYHYKDGFSNLQLAVRK